WVDRVGPNPQPLRPNIVLILSDDQRFDTIDLTHSKDGATPVMPTVLSEIVGKGVSFNNSFVTTALCAPSRSSLLTGKYSHTTGVHDNGGSDGGFQAFNDASTVAVWMKAAGYHTGLYGKYINGYNTGAPYIPPGWDEWHAFKNVAYFDYTLEDNGSEVAYGSADTDYSTDVLRDLAVQFIHDSAAQLPFFLYFSPQTPPAPPTPGPPPCGQLLGPLALAAAELQRGRRVRQTGLVAGDRPVASHEAGEHGRLRPEAAREPAGGRRGRCGAAPGPPGHRAARQHPHH